MRSILHPGAEPPVAPPWWPRPSRRRERRRRAGPTGVEPLSTPARAVPAEPAAILSAATPTKIRARPDSGAYAERAAKRRDEERRVGRADGEERHQRQRKCRHQCTADQGQCDDRDPAGGQHLGIPTQRPHGDQQRSGQVAQAERGRQGRAGRWIQTESRRKLDGDHRQAPEHQSGRHGRIGDPAQRTECGEESAGQRASLAERPDPRSPAGRAAAWRG